MTYLAGHIHKHLNSKDCHIKFPSNWHIIEFDLTSPETNFTKFFENLNQSATVCQQQQNIFLGQVCFIAIKMTKQNIVPPKKTMKNIKSLNHRPTMAKQKKKLQLATENTLMTQHETNVAAIILVNANGSGNNFIGFVLTPHNTKTNCTNWVKCGSKKNVFY